MPEEKCRIKTKPLELNREKKTSPRATEIFKSVGLQWQYRMLNDPCVFSKAHWWICSLISNKAEEEFFHYGYSSPHEKIWTLACFPTHLEAYLQSYLKVSNDCKSVCRSQKIILQRKQTFAFKSRAFRAFNDSYSAMHFGKKLSFYAKDCRASYFAWVQVKALETSKYYFFSYPVQRKKMKNKNPNDYLT